MNDDSLKTLKPWVTFGGCVLIVVVLYWAKALIVPIALAFLLTFVLSPPVNWLQRWIGRVAAVLVVGTLVFAVLGLAGWGIARQMTNLAEDLPRYRANIRAKIADVRGASKGGTVEKLQETIEGIKTDLGQPAAPTGPPARRVEAAPPGAESLPGFGWLTPVVGPLGTAGLVVAMVVFMLLERRDLRDRLIALFGHGQLATTTKALEEAGTRVSRQLLMQSLVNLTYGSVAGIGLYFLNVPYPWIWAALGASLRFIPYVGPLIGAGAPILVSLAALKGWIGPLWVIGLFVLLELFTNLVLETVLYAGAAGVSQVALLVSVAFWTWLWGPLGLLMATPLTVCLVVLGKHVPGFEFLGKLMADTPALTPEYGYYQRLVARDQSEAADLIEQHIKTEPPRSVYDALLLPALNYAKRDRLEGRLSKEEEVAVIDATRELLPDAAESIRRLPVEAVAPREGSPAPALPVPAPGGTAAAAGGGGARLSEPLRVLGYGIDGVTDELALAMLARLLEDLPVALEIARARLQASEIVTLVQQEGIPVVVFADLPPSSLSKTRYLVRRLRAAVPDVRILVGRWAPPLLADEGPQVLQDAGANLIASTLEATRAYLLSIVEAPPTPENETPGPSRVGLSGATARPVESASSKQRHDQHHDE